MIGMVVPDTTPVLELQGFRVSDARARDRVKSLSLHSIAKTITSGGMNSLGVESMRYREKMAKNASGVILLPAI